MRRFPLLFPLLCTVAFCQTVIYTPHQILGPVTTEPVVFVCLPPATTPAGNCTLVGLRVVSPLVVDTVARELRVSLPPPQQLAEREHVVVADGTTRQFTLPETPSGIPSVSVGGLTYSTGVDFTLSGQVVTFIVQQTPPKGSVVRFFYRRPAP